MQVSNEPIFQQQWSLYQKLVKENYMLHAQWEKQTAAMIQKYFSTTPFEMLDLGCGDALPIYPCVKDQPMVAYTGVDLSAPALQLAKQHLSSLTAIVKLHECSMEAFLSGCNETYDLIYSSYAIHHLVDDQKRTLLKQCHATLKENGIMIYIDIYREDINTLDVYRQAYSSMVNNDWNILNEAEKNTITNHLNTCDFPVQLPVLQEWLPQIGFDIQGGIIRDKFHMMMVLKKKS
jgi:ubiquinone/menaquinone biosynthesis C-methylase UbiE